jgi:hypothetical protein
MRLPVGASGVVARLAKEIPAVRHERKAFALALEGLASLFDSTSGTLFLYRRARAALYKVRSLGGEESWDMDTVMRFFLNEKPELPPDTIMAPVRVGKQVVGVVALLRPPGFEPGAGKVATEILRIVGGLLGSRRHVALVEAESAIAGALLRRVRPKDVVYRIFHALRRFIDYDHGATLLARAGDDKAHIAARQTAWGGGKSDIVGETVDIPWQALPAGVETFAIPGPPAPLGMALAQVREDGSPPKRSVMVGALGEGGAHAGCVEVSSTQADFFVDKDIGILTRFLPYLWWCLSKTDEDRWRLS